MNAPTPYPSSPTLAAQLLIILPHTVISEFTHTVHRCLLSDVEVVTAGSHTPKQIAFRQSPTVPTIPATILRVSSQR